MKVVIVGAGIAGLAIGWRLAQSQISVEILDRGLTGRGASWASAGMIAPGAELGHSPDATQHLARAARVAWPSFAAELELASNVKIGYREVGTLLVAEDIAKAKELEAQAASLRQSGVKAVWCQPDQMRAKEYLLSTELFGALHMPDDAQVDNRDLMDALALTARNAGAIFRENCDVVSVHVVAGRARGIITNQGIVEADAFILACGAWTNLLGGMPANNIPPIRPVKGQMLALEPSRGTALPHSLIWADDVYLVPRKSRLFVGATVEDAEFDTSVSCAARDKLFAAASRLIPSLTEWVIAEMWAGLRPRTPDDAPILGATDLDGLFVASGQFRNGILFAPLIADYLRNLVLGGASNADFSAFDPRRFAELC